MKKPVIYPLLAIISLFFSNSLLYGIDCGGPLTDECFAPTADQKLCATASNIGNILIGYNTMLSLIDVSQSTLDLLIPNTCSIFDLSLATESKLCSTNDLAQTNLALIASQTDLITALDSQLEALNPTLEHLVSTVDGMEDVACAATSIIDFYSLSPQDLLNHFACSPTPITTATTISVSGVYCLNNDITGPLLIAADDVVLDLNSHRVNGSTNAIEVAANQLRIAVYNGVASGATNGLLVNDGVNELVVADVQALDNTSTGILLQGTISSPIRKISLKNISALRNGSTGISCIYTTNGTIANSTASSNQTGMSLTNASALSITQCAASTNGIAGFNVLNTTSSTFQHCKALSNGGQSATDGFGFVSTNGSGNIFSECLADSTQTATTNFANVAAGFALLGTEQCSKIVDCSACNAFAPFTTQLISTQTAVYSALPCGIFVDSISSKTLIQYASVNPGDGGDSDNITTANWSSDGKYLAVGGNISGSSNNDLLVYQFDACATTSQLTLVASISPGGAGTDTINSVNWSPDGTYLAVGGTITGNDLIVYQFDPSALFSNRLLEIASLNPGGSGDTDIIYSVNWSPDGTYLAVGGNINASSTGNDLIVYQFDPCATPANRLREVASVNPDGGSDTDEIYSLNWSSDGKYLAVGGIIFGTLNNAVIVYQFDPSASFANRLIEVASINPGLALFDSINSVNWSGDGKYLAIGGQINFLSTGNDLIVYQFDPSVAFANRLIEVASINPGLGADDTINSVNWSPDGKYLAVGGIINGISSNDLIVYQFDPSASFSNRLLEITSINPAGGGSNDTINSVNWSPDGTYLAIGGAINPSTTGNDLIIYQFKQNFPTKNFIQNNTANCNSTTDATCPRGTGISGSSIQNCIIGNTAYNNPFNYTFVTNVYSQLLSGNTLPSPLQNISLIGCQPICQPCDIASEIQYAQVLACTSNIDSIFDQLVFVQSILAPLPIATLGNLSTTSLSTICAIESIIDLPSCAPIAITAPTTITAGGLYCLATTITGQITINADKVSLDMNGQQITSSTNGIAIESGRQKVSIFNGTVGPVTLDGITTATGTSKIMLSTITAHNAGGRGISLDGSSTTLVKNCRLHANSTGMELNNANTIIIDNCTATSNSVAGFSLISSSTNAIRNCTALSNGISASGNGFGFVSTNGSANMFSDCFADYTQTATTNFCNVAAGFALLGTEQCSKITDCTSTNAFGPFTTSLLGTQTTIRSARPHGIYIDSISTPSLIEFASISPVGDINIYQEVNWSPDGKYLAIARSYFDPLGFTDSLFICRFDLLNTSSPLTQIASINSTVAQPGSRLTLNWSPDGTYLATGGNIGSGNQFDLIVYQFNPAAINPLVVFASIDTGGTPPDDNVQSVNWSPNGIYLAVGGALTGNDLIVYQFDACATPTNRLTQFASISTGAPTDEVRSVNWSPNGVYIAVGGDLTTNDLQVYRFDPSQTTASNRLTLFESINPGAGINDRIYSVNWSPDGTYLAIGGDINIGTMNNDLIVYQFDPNASLGNRLIEFASVSPLGLLNDDVLSVNWSADGKYLAAGTNEYPGNNVFVYQFDLSATSSTNRLTIVSSANPAADIGDQVLSVNWSPDGTYLAISGTINRNQPIGNDLVVYQFKQNFPTKNYIQNNTVNCNSTASASVPRGTGISGSSLQNCIIGNTAYNNPFNYTFVNNTFTQLLDGYYMPSPLQNVALNANQSVSTPLNIAQELLCIEQKYCFMLSKMDLILSATTL